MIISGKIIRLKAQSIPHVGHPSMHGVVQRPFVGLKFANSAVIIFGSHSA